MEIYMTLELNCFLNAFEATILIELTGTLSASCLCILV